MVYLFVARNANTLIIFLNYQSAVLSWYKRNFNFNANLRVVHFTSLDPHRPNLPGNVTPLTYRSNRWLGLLKSETYQAYTMKQRFKDDGDYACHTAYLLLFHKHVNCKLLLLSRKQFSMHTYCCTQYINRSVVSPSLFTHLYKHRLY